MAPSSETRCLVYGSGFGGQRATTSASLVRGVGPLFAATSAGLMVGMQSTLWTGSGSHLVELVGLRAAAVASMVEAAEAPAVGCSILAVFDVVGLWGGRGGQRQSSLAGRCCPLCRQDGDNGTE